MHTGLEGIVPNLLWIVEISFFFLSIFKEPALGIYVLIPLLPLESVRYRLHGYILGAQYVDVLLLGVILGLRRRGLPVFPETPIRKLLFLYIAFTYLAMVRGSFFLDTSLPIWFSDRRVSDWKNAVVDLSLMFLVSTSAIRTMKQMKYLLTAMCVGVLLLVKNFHGEMADRDFSSFSYNLRDAGAMGGAGVNGLAAFAAQVAVFLVALYLFEKRPIRKVALLAPIVGSMYCVLFALSRGAYAALLIGLIFLGIVRSRLLLLAVAIFLVTWQSVVPTAVRERIFMTKDASGEIDHSAEARLDLWEEAMQAFQSNPIFGEGFNTYAYRSHVGGYGDSHNLYVKALVETGVIGLLLLVAIFGKLLQMGYRLFRSATDPFLKAVGLGFAGLMLAVLLGNFFGDRWMYFQITGYTYAFAAMVVRAQAMTDEGSQEDDLSLVTMDSELPVQAPA